MNKRTRILGRIGVTAGLVAGGVLLGGVAQAATPPPGSITTGIYNPMGNGYLSSSCTGDVVQTATMSISDGVVQLRESDAHGYCLDAEGIRTDLPTVMMISQWPSADSRVSYNFARTWTSEEYPVHAGVAADPATNPCIQWSYTVSGENVYGHPQIGETVSGEFGC